MCRLQSLLEYKACSDSWLKGKYMVRNHEGDLVTLANSESEALDLVKADAIKKVKLMASELFPDMEIQQSFFDGIGSFKSAYAFQILESYFSAHRVDVSLVKPASGSIRNYNSEIKLLTRPYLALSDEDYEQLHSIGCDFFVTPSGVKLTFGVASVEGGKTKYALMPYSTDSDDSFFAKMNV